MALLLFILCTTNILKDVLNLCITNDGSTYIIKSSSKALKLQFYLCLKELGLLITPPAGTLFHISASKESGLMTPYAALI